jgi:hypothetical protein
MAMSIQQWSTAQVQDEVVSVGPGYVNQVYYSLSNGELNNNALNSWDIAFDVTFYGVGIRANTVTGVEVSKYPGDMDDWNSVDTTNFGSWEKLHDDPIDWSTGAFNANSEGFNVGWGTYSTVTHNTTGHSIFIVKLQNGDFKKIKFEGQISGVYQFTYSDLNGENEVISSLAKADYSNKNYAYYSLQNNEAYDYEPERNTWDLVFGKYMDLAPSIYGVTGVRQNIGVAIAQIDGIATTQAGLADATTAGYSTDINIIGHDWKSINMSTFQWDIIQNRSYIAKSIDHKYYKIVFTGFSGSGSGNFIFTREYLGDVVGIDESSASTQFFMYPNPVSTDNHQVQLVIETYKPELLEIRITDTQGRVVKQIQQQVSGELQTMQLDVATLNAGLYHVSVISSAAVATQKLIVR